MAKILATEPGRVGLSYNSIEGMKMGVRLLELLSQDGTVIASATSKLDVSDQPTNEFYNFNYYVVELQNKILKACEQIKHSNNEHRSFMFRQEFDAHRHIFNVIWSLFLICEE
ncbi:hypothetical protein GGS21DRAFT_487457 [Xylaria nigripes]|nr:hypothetical protein GGS21DRAFT_487457 [Xylaria nigripes]